MWYNPSRLSRRPSIPAPAFGNGSTKGTFPSLGGANLRVAVLKEIGVGLINSEQNDEECDVRPASPAGMSSSASHSDGQRSC